jgi:hypothetical protein
MLENTRKIKFAPSNQPMPQPEAPPINYIWNIGQPTCPLCRCVFNVALQVDKYGEYLNYDIASNTVIVEHGDGPVKFCANQGKRFRYKIPSIEVEEI